MTTDNPSRTAGWRLAFSTLGCSGQALPDVFDLTRSGPWRGLELWAAEDEPVHTGLDRYQRHTVRAELRRAADSYGVIALAVASYVRVASEQVTDATCVSAALAYARLAADLGIPHVRVFPGATDIEAGAGHDGSVDRADDRAVRRLLRIVADLPDRMDLLLETHDSIRAAPISSASCPAPGRIGSARCGTCCTCGALASRRRHRPAPGPYLVHAQVKDIASPTERTPLPQGAGNVSLTAFYGELDRMGYEGHLSLEWESKWYPDALPLPEALAASVLPERPRRPPTGSRDY